MKQTNIDTFYTAWVEKEGKANTYDHIMEVLFGAAAYRLGLTVSAICFFPGVCGILLLLCIWKKNLFHSLPQTPALYTMTFYLLFLAAVVFFLCTSLVSFFFFQKHALAESQKKRAIRIHMSRIREFLTYNFSWLIKDDVRQQPGFSTGSLVAGYNAVPQTAAKAFIPVVLTTLLACAIGMPAISYGGDPVPLLTMELGLLVSVFTLKAGLEVSLYYVFTVITVIAVSAATIILQWSLAPDSYMHNVSSIGVFLLIAACSFHFLKTVYERYTKESLPLIISPQSDRIIVITPCNGTESSFQEIPYTTPCTVNGTEEGFFIHFQHDNLDDGFTLLLKTMPELAHFIECTEFSSLSTSGRAPNECISASATGLKTYLKTEVKPAVAAGLGLFLIFLVAGYVNTVFRFGVSSYDALWKGDSYRLHKNAVAISGFFPFSQINSGIGCLGSIDSGEYGDALHLYNLGSCFGYEGVSGKALKEIRETGVVDFLKAAVAIEQRNSTPSRERISTSCWKELFNCTLQHMDICPVNFPLRAIRKAIKSAEGTSEEYAKTLCRIHPYHRLTNTKHLSLLRERFKEAAAIVADAKRNGSGFENLQLQSMGYLVTGNYKGAMDALTRDSENAPLTDPDLLLFWLSISRFANTTSQQKATVRDALNESKIRFPDRALDFEIIKILIMDNIKGAISQADALIESAPEELHPLILALRKMRQYSGHIKPSLWIGGQVPESGYSVENSVDQSKNDLSLQAIEARAFKKGQSEKCIGSFRFLEIDWPSYILPEDFSVLHSIKKHETSNQSQNRTH